MVDWPPGGKTLNQSAPGILEDALVQLLEEVVHPYHISPEEHDNLEYRLLVSLAPAVWLQQCVFS